MTNVNFDEMSAYEIAEYQARHTTMEELRATAADQLDSLGESPEQLDTWTRADWERYAACFEQVIDDEAE